MEKELTLSELKKQLTAHPLYSRIHSLQDIHVFMESHVFAVWDFMSLLKSLQNELTCTTVPWTPIGNQATRRLINEIVLGEESDESPDGSFISHFELYLQAMKECGANTHSITTFIELIQAGKPVDFALDAAQAPQEAKAFVLYTMSKIKHDPLHCRAALFTYGREDLIPGMFLSLVEQLNNTTDNLKTFVYYLKRHIELDGDHHSHMASAMTESLIEGNDQKFQETQTTIIQAYEHRLKLWDGIHQRLVNQSLN